MTEREESIFTAQFFHFLFHGILTNSIFVILNSVAKDIDASSVGLVYLANSAPVFFVKLLGTYFFHLISYRQRYLLCSLLFIASVTTVSYSISVSSNFNHALVGVALSSAAGGLGEPSTLALATYLDKKSLISAFSAGTGFAGVFGYLWTIFFKDFIGLDSSIVVGLAIIIPICLVLNYIILIEPKVLEKDNEIKENDEKDLLIQNSETKIETKQIKITFQDKLNIFIYLKSYMFILFLVYFSEYAMQSGVWATMGSPVTMRNSRDEMYIYANFLYQLGVLCSRSSSIFFQTTFRTNSFIPILQFILLVLFYLNGVYWYINSTFIQLVFCYIAGLFGGLVYVNTFILISKDINIPIELKEFSVSAANIADTVGVTTGDIVGLFIQGCLYGVNKVKDFDSAPDFTCGYNFTN